MNGPHFDRVDDNQAGTNGEEPDAAGLVGSVFEERYKILAVLGCGGMSVVYEAEDIVLGRLVAVKLLKTSRLSEPAARKRFQQEGQLLSSLEHPHIAKIFSLALTKSGQPYIAMEKLSGKTLSEFLKELPAGLDTARAMPIFGQICQGLAHAHGQGVIHRDLKPSNIMLCAPDPTGRTTGGGITGSTVKIFDFGIAKRFDSEGQSAQQLTQTGEIFGSPFYMSPEQCVGAPADARADIYALGCIFYEVLTGSPPFVGKTAVETLSMHLSQAPPPVRRGSRRLAKLIARCLEKKPADRYQSVSQILSDLNYGGSSSRWRIVLPFESGVKLWKVALVLTLVVSSLVALVTCLGPDETVAELVQSLPLGKKTLQFVAAHYAGANRPLTSAAVLRRLLSLASKTEPQALSTADLLVKMAACYKQMGLTEDCAIELNRAIRIYVVYLDEKNLYDHVVADKLLAACRAHPLSSPPDFGVLRRLYDICERTMIGKSDKKIMITLGEASLMLVDTGSLWRNGKPVYGLAAVGPIKFLIQAYQKVHKPGAEVERLQRVVIDIYERNGGSNHDQAVAYLELAKMLGEHKRTAESKTAAMHALELVSGVNALPRMQIQCLGFLLLLTDLETKPEEYLKWANQDVAVARDAHQMDLRERIEILNGVSYVLQQKSWAGKPVTREAVQLAYTLARGQRHNEDYQRPYLEAVANLYAWFVKDMRYQQAKQVALEAYPVAVKYDTFEAARCSNWIGDACLYLGDYAGALPYYLQCDRLAAAVHKPDKEIEVLQMRTRALQSASDCCRRRLDLKTALALTYRAQPLCMKLPPDDPSRLTYEVGIPLQQGAILRSQGHREEAEKILLPLYRFARERYGVDDWRYQSVIYELVACSFDLKKVDQGEALIATLVSAASKLRDPAKRAHALKFAHLVQSTCQAPR